MNNVKENVFAATRAGFNFDDFYMVELSGETQETTEKLLDESKKLMVKVVKAPMPEDKAEEEVISFIVDCVKDHGAKPKLKISGVVGKVKETITALFGWNEAYRAYCFILNNKDKIMPLIEQAAFENQKEKDKLPKVNDIWEKRNIPKLEVFNKNKYTKMEYKKYAFNECWLNLDGNGKNNEKKFMDFLDVNDKVEWWWHNRNSGDSGFAVKYVKNGQGEKFLPDFIVKFVNGTVGLFDTKGGWTAEDKEKPKGLYEYIQQYSTDKDKIIGGIVVDHNGFKINTSKDYEYNHKKLGEDWVNFSDYLSTTL